MKSQNETFGILPERICNYLNEKIPDNKEIWNHKIISISEVKEDSNKVLASFSKFQFEYFLENVFINNLDNIKIGTIGFNDSLISYDLDSVDLINIILSMGDIFQKDLKEVGITISTSKVNEIFSIKDLYTFFYNIIQLLEEKLNRVVNPNYSII